MGRQKPISRNSFLRIMTALILGLVAWTWHRLSGFQIAKEGRIEFRHGRDIPLGISYFGKYYLIRTENSVRAFSTTCTHAGCRIGASSGTVLQCNCHGSRFEAETGNPLKGPAIRPLQEFECRWDEKAGQWVVKLEPIRVKTT